MKLSDNGLALLKELEGFRAEAYDDSAGRPTVGYGHLLTENDTLIVTKQQAEQLLRQDVAKAEDAVNKTAFVTQPNQNQFDALVLLTFNIGVTKYNSSTIRKILTGQKSGNPADQFDKWVYVTVNGEKQIVQGLVKRRKAERELFET